MSRRRLDVTTAWFPAYVVWELTLRCDQRCAYCGSRAGAPRADELCLEEALAVAQQLAALGTREVVLMGGEAYLFPGFLPLANRLAELGVTPTLTTGGHGLDEELARRMKAAGIERVSVSIDGMKHTHDRLRRRQGGFERASRALAVVRDAGIRVAANTNVNRLNQADLEPLYEYLRQSGVESWQLHLTTPIGGAADRHLILLQPWDLLALMPTIMQLKTRGLAEGLLLFPGDNLGYFGSEEAMLRSLVPGQRDHFHGCQAGRFILGIESNGRVKGCSSLPSVPYVVGSVRDRSLSDLWRELAGMALPSHGAYEPWGFCATCPFVEDCRGGCAFTAHAVLGRVGNNPFCHYRARDFARRGLRERLVLVERAATNPLACGRFEIVVEPLTAPDPAESLTTDSLLLEAQVPP